jgi:hypothetical protein
MFIDGWCLYECNSEFYVINRDRWTSHKVPRRIFEPKREDVTAGWGYRYNEELNNLYSSFIIYGEQTKDDEMSGICSAPVEV